MLVLSSHRRVHADLGDIHQHALPVAGAAHAQSSGPGSHPGASKWDSRRKGARRRCNGQPRRATGGLVGSGTCAQCVHYWRTCRLLFDCN